MNSPSQAVQNKQQHPATLVLQVHGARLAAMVPSHVNGESWVRQAAATLRDEKLAEAASVDFDSFMIAIDRAAVLGLRPGSEEFYLNPRKVKGKLQVQGIIGYQGLVDLMYRAGSVASVVVETVRQADTFRYTPGRDERPIHEIDWDAEDRGDLRLAYAYAVMSSGATSKVVVINRQKMYDQHRAKSDGYTKFDGSVNPYSPWVTNEEAMWLKTGARQLSKWVPTSVEYIAQRVQAHAVGVTNVTNAQAPAASLHGPQAPAIGVPAAITGGLDDEAADRLAGEVPWPSATEPGAA